MEVNIETGTTTIADTRNWILSCKVAGYIYRITRAQQAKLKSMIGVAHLQWRRLDGAGGICTPAPAEKGRRKMGAVIFLQHEIYTNFCELCWGRNGHEGTNHLHRTMYILDVISVVSRSSKCNKIVGGWGFTPEPTGRADSAPPNPLAGFKGPTLKPVLVRGMKGSGRERAPKWSVPRPPETFALPLLDRGRTGGPRTLVCVGGGTIWSYATASSGIVVVKPFRI